MNILLLRWRLLPLRKGCCRALKSGCWIFCCCDNTPGWTNLSGAAESECLFIKWYLLHYYWTESASLLTSIAFKYSQRRWKTELWAVMLFRVKGLKKKQPSCVFVPLIHRVHVKHRADVNPRLLQARKKTLSKGLCSQKLGSISPCLVWEW